MEISDLIDSHNRKHLADNKEKVLLFEFLAKRTYEYNNALFSKHPTIEPVWTFFPELFEKEQKEIEQKEIEKQLTINRERMRAFAEFTKKKYEQIGGE